MKKKITLIILVLGIAGGCGTGDKLPIPCYAQHASEQITPPKDLWKAIVAEAASEGFIGMYAVACVVRNRLSRGLSIGLVGASRKDLDSFIARQGKKTIADAQRAVAIAFGRGATDITYGALFFESIDFPEGIREYDRLYVRQVQIRKHIFYVPKEYRGW